MKAVKYLFLVLIAGILSCSKDDNSDINVVGGIYGIVTISDSAEPMRATGVELYKDNSLLLRTVTFDDGHFEFTDLRPGTYDLVIVAEGFQTARFSVIVESGRVARADIQLVKLETYMDVSMKQIEAYPDGKVIFYGSLTEHTYDRAQEQGFIYGKNNNINLNNGTIVKAADFKFIVQVSGLEPGIWYVMPYAKNKYGYAFGNIESFEISGLPEVETLITTNVMDNSATLNGFIKYEGNPKYSEKGFVYSSYFKQPTIEDPADASYKITVSGNSKEFSANITGLEKDKIYYVRAYATANGNTVYGNVDYFTATSYRPYVRIDNLLIQKSDLSKNTYFDAAEELCSNSTVGDLTGWRLPTIGELSLMYANKDKIGGFSDEIYWSSTYDCTLVTGTYYYVLDFKTGQTSSVRTIDAAAYVRAVGTIDANTILP